MSTTPKKALLDREGTWILLLTALAAILRCSSLGRLGIDHFDEGIYASVGTWSLTKGGLSSLDPGLIPYAPPLYPILVGLSYLVFGVSDFAAIVPSLLAGIAIVPLVGWLGRRWFGEWRGVACAALACACGPHIVFSRMALTDSTFALTWLLAIAAGVEFLKKPGPGRAALMGLAVGLAQLTKYNGWLAGAIVILAAVVGLVFDREQRTRSHLLKTFGWGFLGAVIAASVYWPWFRFVENHGGYADLLRHQRSYLGTVSAWPGHLVTQLFQSARLGGEFWMKVALFGLLVFILLWVTPWDRAGSQVRRPKAVDVVFMLCLLPVAIFRMWWLVGAVVFPRLIRRSGAAERVVAAWWIALTILTPLYHPYARLWLPMEVVGCFLGGLLIAGLWERAVSLSFQTYNSESPPRKRKLPWSYVALVAFVIVAFQILGTEGKGRDWFPDIREPRDSLRIASAQFASEFPPGLRSIKVLARPALTFYLAPALAARGVATSRAQSLSDLAAQPNEVAILDTVQLWQEIPKRAERNAWLSRFEILARAKNELSPATLLDVDPNAATGDLSARTQEILLLKRKRETQP